MSKMVLASGSPRRRELLEMLGVKDLVILPAKGEEIAPEHAGPGEIVCALSSAKAHEVAAQCGSDDIVLAADTIVWFKGQKYGKPHSQAEAKAMLTALSGQTHEVYTGVCVLRGGTEIAEYERTEVRFRMLSAPEIDRYIATGEPMDKAGAYGIQGVGSLLVEGIDGDFFNVMGLPLCRVGKILSGLGVGLL